MIAVGHGRDDAGRPSVVEKAQPDSEIAIGCDGPSFAEEVEARGGFWDGPDHECRAPRRIYSHSSSDVRRTDAWLDDARPLEGAAR